VRGGQERKWREAHGEKRVWAPKGHKYIPDPDGKLKSDFVRDEKAVKLPIQAALVEAIANRIYDGLDDLVARVLDEQLARAAGRMTSPAMNPERPTVISRAEA
jgi:hypothetical protein